MNYLNEWRQFYNVGDNVLIEYWYNNMLTPVTIKDKKDKKWLVSHKTNNSKIQNAPDEWISSSDILDKDQRS
jgi:hypothetical protein